jgi:L-alanine-DL-glutamate epimerase-like enolase superfamily enzyme
VDEAITMAHKFQAFNPMWLEEPVWPPEDHVGLARVRAAGGLAIAAGENATTSDFKRMFEVGAVTYAQPSITKVGGVTEMRKVMALAQTFGVSVVPHSAYFGPGLLASIHCIAAMPRESLVERYDCDFAVNPLHDAIHPRDGRIAVPQGPGLGVEPDANVLEQLRVR